MKLYRLSYAQDIIHFEREIKCRNGLSKWLIEKGNIYRS